MSSVVRLHHGPASNMEGSRLTFRIVFLSVAMIFCMFPYTQIIPFYSYTQPYAFLFCLIAFAIYFSSFFRKFPTCDAMGLLCFALLGLLLFLLTCFPYTSAEDQKKLLIYLGPLVFAAMAYLFVRTDPKLARRVVSVSAVIWLVVGLVQTLIDPRFATGLVGEWQVAAVVVVDSGRGVLGLAPEPTHYGFHLLLLASMIVILRGNRLLAVSCVLGALLLARSSSALLALILGTGLFLFLNPKKLRVLAVPLVVAAILIFYLTDSYEVETVRLFQLLTAFVADPTGFLVLDESANMRLGGVIVAVKEIWSAAFMPHGMSTTSWLEEFPGIFQRNPWLINLSESGLPSGLLVVVYQSGFIGLFLLAIFLSKFFNYRNSDFEKWLILSVLFVFLGQYYISNPGFGLIYGFLLYAGKRRAIKTRTQADA